MPTILLYFIQVPVQAVQVVQHKDLLAWMAVVVVFLIGVIGFFVRFHFSDDKKTHAALLASVSQLSKDLTARNEQNDKQMARAELINQRNIDALNGRMLVVEDRLGVGRHRSVHDDNSNGEDT